MTMIRPDAMIFRHDPPYKRIDTTHPGRRRVITRKDIENNIVRKPDLAAYTYDGLDTWTLKE